MATWEFVEKLNSNPFSKSLIPTSDYKFFLKYPKFPCDHLEGKGEERPHPAPEVDLSKAPTPIVDPGRVVALLSMLSLADWMSATRRPGQGCSKPKDIT